MTRRNCTNPATFLLVFGGTFGLACGCLAEGPSPAAISAFNSYVSGVELRLDQQHRSASAFFVEPGQTATFEQRLRGGEVILEKLTPTDREDMPGAMLQHWRGTAFAAGAKAADFERLMKDFSAYPKHFSPEVVQARMLFRPDGGTRGRFAVSMRVRQRHVITVVMDTDYDITYGRLDAGRGYSISRSTRIAEIDSAGTRSERVLSPSEENGFLWRLNTYWSYEERDGGLYMQIESVSVTRSIPVGLGWAVRPFAESVPRESLEFTLRAVCSALRK